MKEFRCATRILSGAGALDALADMQIRQLLLVCDPYFSKNGMAQAVADRAKARQVRIFDAVQPDPDVLLAARGTAVVQAFAPDAIVALGGGSAMDCAKAMAYFSGSRAMLIAIPTTSGSGSEVTDFAVLTHEAGKYPLVDPKLRPDVAILDPSLLTQLPAGLVADSGFDILSHAMEAIAAKNAGAITDALAQSAFCKAFSALPASFCGETGVRLSIHEAATMTGMAFTQAGLGVCHSLAHSLGGLFHVPHGRLNAILLPHVIAVNAAAATEKYAAAARAAGLAGSTDALAVRNLRSALLRLRRQLGLPGSLSQAGISSAQLKENRARILQTALEDPCCATNPVKVDIPLLERLLDGAWADG